MVRSCLFCGTQEKLVIDVTMSLVEGEPPVAVCLCEQHKNKTQISALKKAYLKKRQAIEKLKQQAKQYGFDVLDSQPAQAPRPQAAPASKPQPAPSIVRIKPQEQPASDPATPSGPIVAREKQRFANVPTDPVEAPRIAAHEIDPKKAPRVFSTTEQVVERGDGLPIKIPKKIVGEAGETDIRVIQTGGDAAMQTRLKNLKQALDQNDTAHIFHSDGYALRTCTLCQGKGKTAINGQICPKCNGAGEISKI
jgi:hypothetical protein